MAYIPLDYWRAQHEIPDLRGVGQGMLPARFNDWCYRAAARNLRSFLRRHGLTVPPPASVFEIGAGTGYWVPFWRSLGAADVDGCDLVPEAVERLNRQFGGSGRFLAAAIDSPSFEAARTYELVTAFNVLLHIVEPPAFERALHNAAALVSPGGRLLLFEPIRVNPALEWSRPEHPSSLARLLDGYRRPLEQAGLRLVAIEGATAVAGNPIEGRSPVAARLWRRNWALLARIASSRPRAASAAGAVACAVDPLLLRLGAAPSGKFALFRRPGGP